MLNLHAICLCLEIERAAEDCAPASSERLARRRVSLSNKQVPWADWKKVVCLACREAISAISGLHSQTSEKKQRES